MDIARIRSAHAQAYVDFKAALSGYLAKIRARVEQAKSHARQIENEQRAFERKGLSPPTDLQNVPNFGFVI